MLKAFKYKLVPTETQAVVLDKTLYLCRQLYNAALEERRTAYRKCNVTVSRFQQDKMLPEIKAALPEYKDVHSQVLQDVLKRLDKGFQAFFRRIKQGEKPGYPRFQGRNGINSFCYPQYKAMPTGKHVYLPKVGNVRVRLSRPLEGKVKTCTVKREANGWYAVFACEVEAKPLPKTGRAIGLDMGFTDIVATSEGELVTAPKYFSKAQKALRKAQRKLARRKRGSANRERARVQVAKLHQKIGRQRADFLHKLSTGLIRENDVIAIEDLNIKGLSSGMLAKSVNDASWGQLTHMLSYKAEEAGRNLLTLPRLKPMGFLGYACLTYDYVFAQRLCPSQKRFWDCYRVAAFQLWLTPAWTHVQRSEFYAPNGLWVQPHIPTANVLGTLVPQVNRTTNSLCCRRTKFIPPSFESFW